MRRNDASRTSAAPPPTMMMPNRRALLCSVTTGLAASALLAMGGCASIVDGNTQSMSVKTQDTGAHELVGIHCTLTNNKGSWFITSPGSVGVHRSYDDLTVSCEAPGQPAGKTVVKSSTKGMAFGNVLVGGLIGAGVDAATGAAYDYPQLITVTMGEVMTPATTQVARPSQPASAPLGQQPASAAEVRRYHYAGDTATEFALHGHASWNGKCAPRMPPKIIFVTAPEHGTVFVRNEPIEIPASADSLCGGHSYDGVRLYYKALDGFRGDDRVVYTVDTGIHVFDVQVAVDVR